MIQARADRPGRSRSALPRARRPARPGRADRPGRSPGRRTRGTDGFRSAYSLLGDDAWVSHEAAAALLGLDRSAPGALQFTDAHVGVAAVHRHGCTVHTTTRIGAVDVLTVCGFRCASATRTILDLAAAGAIAGSPRRRPRQRAATAPVRASRTDRATQPAAWPRTPRCATPRPALDRQWWRVDARATLPRRWFAKPRLPRPDHPTADPQRRPPCCPRRLPLSGPGDGRRGFRSARSFQPGSTVAATPSGATSCRIWGMSSDRIHVGRRHPPPRLRDDDTGGASSSVGIPDRPRSVSNRRPKSVSSFDTNAIRRVATIDSRR